MAAIVMVALAIAPATGCDPTSPSPSPSSQEPVPVPAPGAAEAGKAPAPAIAFLVKTYDANGHQTAKKVQMTVAGISEEGKLQDVVDDQGHTVPGPLIKDVQTPWKHVSHPAIDTKLISARFYMFGLGGEMIVCWLEHVDTPGVMIPNSEVTATIKGGPVNNGGAADVTCGPYFF